ncbi:MAG: hypothetical protein ABI277_03340 [Burkholderiaceae bacterium]
MNRVENGQTRDRIIATGVVQVVNGLQTRGWVTREADGTDARSWRLILTPEGRAKLVIARRRVRAHDRRISQRLGAAERAEVIALLGRLGPAD